MHVSIHFPNDLKNILIISLRMRIKKGLDIQSNHVTCFCIYIARLREVQQSGMTKYMVCLYNIVYSILKVSTLECVFNQKLRFDFGLRVCSRKLYQTPKIQLPFGQTLLHISTITNCMLFYFQVIRKVLYGNY